MRKFSRDLGYLSELAAEAGALDAETRSRLENLPWWTWQVGEMTNFVDGYLQGAGVYMP
jgi:hypothetical protein